MERTHKSHELVTTDLAPFSMSFPQVITLAGVLFIGTTITTTTGCTASDEDVRPPAKQFVFPSGMAVNPDADESALFVANANSDLLYSSGSLVAVDLDAVDDAADRWRSEGRADAVDGNCAPDPQFPEVLHCDAASFITSSVRTGNFTSDIAVQALDSGTRVVVAVRGDPSVTWVDYTGSLACAGNSNSSFPLCDGDNRLLYLRDDVDLDAVGLEPFGVYVNSDEEYGAVTHMSNGRVSLVHLPRDGSMPVVADEVTGLFNSDGFVRAAVGIAARPKGIPGDPSILYVTSRSDSRVWMLSIRPAGGNHPLPALIPSQFFFLDGISGAADARGIAFRSDGNRAYIVNRNFAALHVYDTSLSATGFPKNEFVTAIELCSEPSTVAIAEYPTGDTSTAIRVYAACFSSGQVWVVDPDAGRVVSIINAGRGPHALAVSQVHNKLYVGNYLDNSVVVIDIDPASEDVNRVIMRLGQSQ